MSGGLTPSSSFTALSRSMACRSRTRTHTPAYCPCPCPYPCPMPVLACTPSVRTPCPCTYPVPRLSVPHIHTRSMCPVLGCRKGPVKSLPAYLECAPTCVGQQVTVPQISVTVGEASRLGVIPPAQVSEWP